MNHIIERIKRSFSKNSTPGCIVLNYHGLVPMHKDVILERNFTTYATFKDHIAYLHRHTNIISVKELAYNLEQGIDVSNCSVITFDDGYKNNLQIPEILCSVAHKIPYTVFIAAGLIGNEQHSVWAINLSLLLLKGKLNKVVFRGKEYSLNGAEDRRTTFNEIRHILKNITTEEKDRDYKEILQQYGDQQLIEVFDQYPQFKMMNWQECEYLLENNANIEAHGMLHELQHSKQSQNIIEYEIVESKKIINKNLGYDPVSFSYPNGDFSDHSVTLLKENAYKIAFTTKQGIVHNRDNAFLLNRIAPNNNPKKFINQLYQYH